ncbi:glycosyltransferase family 4 protein [Mesoterricola silvestris]|uniref:Glycosyltransferase WbuB n=1 Tax=Mesoterricola silvestris TaxID=2927979 RepID=A0AA48H3H1_9BACT|nr:glycosyltransferase family 4 protein [Mesoterricola silvestris]BDU71223.1 glycosyltransferase WbuB [Mesoterricola silvestris]
MNILLVNPYALAPDQPGGTRHFSLARALTAMGHSVVIAAGSFDHLTRTGSVPAGEPARRETREGVAFIRLRTPGYRGNGAGRLWNMLAFARAVGTVLPRYLGSWPDVVVGSSPHPFGARAAMGLARRLGVPFVLEIRDVWPRSLTEVMGVSPLHPIVWVLERIERELYRGADRIVTLLPKVARRVEERGGDPAGITWVPNGIDLAMIPPLDEPRDEGPFTVMYAGAHGVTNALDVLVDAAAILQERARLLPRRPALVLVGTGPEKPRLEAKARRLGLFNLTFRPPVPKREIYGLLARADAFWASAADSDLWEHGISFNKLYDYMAMGRPTVLGVRCSTNPILLSGGGLVVAPGSAQAMAEGVERLLLAGPGGRRAMGAKAREFVEAHFDMRRLAQAFESALLAAMGEGCGGAHAS